MSFEIDDRFVDVDLAAEARTLGVLAGYSAAAPRHFTQPAPGRFCGDYADEFVVQSDDERAKAIERMDAEGGLECLVRWILNQKQEGSCVGNAATQGYQVVAAKQFGEANIVPMSAISMYKQIGSSPGSGASCEDALEQGLKVGFLPLDTPENRARFGDKVMPATGFYTPWPPDWKNTAKQFRYDKYLAVRSVAAMEQAGINGHPVVVGRSGHSILYLRPSLKKGRGELYVNSWSIDWGFAAGGLSGGFGFDTGGLVRSSAQWAYAIISVNNPDYVVAA